MRHDYHRARVLDERVLEALDRRHVEMVGRLVEHHRPHLAPEPVGHRELARFAGTRRRGLEQAVGIDAERGDQREHAPALGGVECADPVEHRETVARGEFLRQVEYPLRRDMRPAEHRGQQGSLADSVGAGDANFRVAGHRQMHVFENARIAGADRGLVEREDPGHGSRHVIDENRASLRFAEVVLAELVRNAIDARAQHGGVARDSPRGHLGLALGKRAGRVMIAAELHPLRVPALAWASADIARRRLSASRRARFSR